MASAVAAAVAAAAVALLTVSRCPRPGCIRPWLLAGLDRALSGVCLAEQRQVVHKDENISAEGGGVLFGAELLAELVLLGVG